MKVTKIASHFESQQLLEQVQKEFPQAKMANSIDDAIKYISDIGPKIVYSTIVRCKSLKQCSTVTPIFAARASRDGFATLIAQAPGHFFNVILTKEGALGVDLTTLQFEMNRVADSILESETDDDYDDYDIYGERQASHKLIQEIIDNPFRTIRVWKMNHPQGDPPYQEGASGKIDFYFDEKYQKEETPEYGQHANPKEMTESHPYPVKSNLGVI